MATGRRLTRLAWQLLGTGRTPYYNQHASTKTCGRAARQGLSACFVRPIASRSLKQALLAPAVGSFRPVSIPDSLTFVRQYAGASLPPHEVLAMPSLSPTMSQGNISTWKKKVGDSIAAGDVLCEVETDKATIDWESQEEGFLAKILLPDGTKDIPVGTPVAVVVEEEANVAAFADYSVSSSGGAGDAPKADASAASPPAQEAPQKAASSWPAHIVMEMPALSPTMSQGNISVWKKKEGESFVAGDSLAEIETDKATMEWESQDDGVVAKLLVPEGSKDVAVGQPVLVVVDTPEEVAAFAGFTVEDASGVAKPAAKASAPADAPSSPAPSPPQTPPHTPPSSAPSAPAPAGGRVVASPYAKKLAAEKGLNLAGVGGSGPGGRIVAADVLKLEQEGGAKAAPAVSEAALRIPTDIGAQYEDLPVSQIKRITAARLLESKQTIPHYYLTIDVRLDELMKARSQLNEVLAKQDGAKLSLNDFIIKASALACKKVPAANSAWMGDFIREYHSVDCSVAVQTPNGLMVPIVKDADSKGLAAISADVKRLAAKAREGKLKPDEFMGGTFTVSNLGMFGIKQFAAIINPPQACILAVGAGEQRVVLSKSGEAQNATFMSATLSCDHRVADGAVGAAWLAAFKQYMENPATMLL